MTIGFVIGNGESRNGIDVDALKQHGLVFGCNALIRDFTPDYVVALDKKMEREIETSKFKGKRIYRFYRGQKLPDGSYPLEIKKGKPVNSGVAAIYIALKIGCTELYLVGFDLSNNNIYCGTKNYGRISEKAKRTPPKRVQIHRTISEWAKNNPHIPFHRVYDEKYCWDPHEWKNVIPNLDINEFKEQFGC